MTDLRFNFGTDILVLRSCYNPDGADLLAIAGEDSLQVIQCVSTQLAWFVCDRIGDTPIPYQSNTAIRSLACFRVGLRVTAIAWSPRTVSPSSSDGWFLE